MSDIENEVLNKIMHEKAVQALHNLPVRKARAVELVDIDGSKLKVVAEKLGITIERARQLRKAGEFDLRQMLRPEESDLISD